MAFNRQLAAAPASQDTSWKAQAFINLYVSRADGSKAKLGAIPLRDTKKFDKALIERLQEEGAVEALLDKLEIDFQMANNDAVSDVGF